MADTPTPAELITKWSHDVLEMDDVHPEDAARLLAVLAEHGYVVVQVPDVDLAGLAERIRPSKYAQGHLRDEPITIYADDARAAAAVVEAVAKAQEATRGA